MSTSTPSAKSSVVSRRASWWAENWKALLAVWGVALLPVLPILLSGQIFVSSDQAVAPGWKFYFDSLRSGTIPLWNPYALAGMPTFDLMFGDAAYPPFILLGLFLPVMHVVTYNYVLHLLLAGLTSYLLARVHFRLDRWIAAALAVAWSMNPHIISYIFSGHTGKYFVLAWLPLVVLFLLRALSPAATWKDLLGLALGIAAFMLTSHLQFTYFALMGFFIVWVYSLGGALRARRFAEAGSLALRFWAPILLGIGLTFFIFYPPMQYTKEFGIRGGPERTSYEHAISWSMHPEEAASLLVPEFGGLNELYWGRNPFKSNTESPGLLVWFLGLLGLLAFRRTRWFWLWGAIGALAIIYGLGGNTPLFRLFYEYVPGVKNFRAASMMLFWLAMALLVVSAETVRRLLSAGPDAVSDRDRGVILRRLKLFGWPIVGLLGVFVLFPGAAYAIWGLFADESQLRLQIQGFAASSFALGCLRAAVLLAILIWATSSFLLRDRRPFAFGMIALLVAVVDAYWINLNVSGRLAAPGGRPLTGFIVGQEPGRGFATEPAIEFLKEQSAQSRFRVFGLPGAFNIWNGLYFGLEIVDGWADNEMRVYRTYRGDDYQRNPNFFVGLNQNEDGTVSGNVFLDMLNVEYLAFRPREVPGMQLVRNASALPRTWFVPQWEAVTDSQALRRIQDPDFDPRRLALISGEGVASGGTVAAAGASLLSAKEKEWGPNRTVHEITVADEGILVFSEMWFPHWHAIVNGAEVPVLRTNFAFRGLHLKPGTHEIVFVYRSPWIRTGWMVAGASAVALAGLCFGFGVLRRKASRSAG